jgi:hypothetical protein
VATTILHLAFPPQIVNGAFVTVDQDSDEEIVGCMDAILLCPVGYRDALPDFGRPNLDFTRITDDRLTGLRAAITTSEPRITTVLADEEIDDRAVTITLQGARG